MDKSDTEWEYLSNGACTLTLIARQKNRAPIMDYIQVLQHAKTDRSRLQTRQPWTRCVLECTVESRLVKLKLKSFLLTAVGVTEPATSHVNSCPLGHIAEATFVTGPWVQNGKLLLGNTNFRVQH